MSETEDAADNKLIDRHLRFGWWSLLAFLTLGLVLESFHAFKVRSYLDVGQEARRLMWTLAHAHGVLLSLVHLAFAASVRARPQRFSGRVWASPLLMSASILMPGGFFLAGIHTYGGDPGIGIMVVPVGGAALFVAVALIARAITRSHGK